MKHSGVGQSPTPIHQKSTKPYFITTDQFTREYTLWSVMMNVIKIGIFMVCSFFYSCSKEEFVSKKVTDNSNSTNPIQYFSDQRCSTFSLVKPKVDFLFLWDNSGSQLFVTPETKSALNQLILKISSSFDFRMLLAPLLPSTTGSDPQYLVASNPDNLNSYATGLLTPYDQAPNKLSTFPTSNLGSREDGLNRVLTIMNTNRASGTGIFRNGAYTMIVIMSNGDDNSFVPEGWTPNEAQALTYVGSKRDDFQNLRDNILHSLQLRFFSLVGHQTCSEVPRVNVVYKTMSSYMYSESGASDQQGTYPDSYDICSMDFSNMFDGINSSISYQVVKHVYNYWPIATSASVAIDSNKITVTKDGANVPRSSSNGYEYVGYQTNRNTRIQPSAGEPFTGYMVKLNGSAQVTYPECLIINTQTPAEYFGYIHLANKPDVGTVFVSIDGTTIGQSTTNGWEYVGYKNNQNVKILDQSHPTTPGTPALNKTGYFLKMNGNGIYTNNSKVEVKYQPGL